MRHKLLTVLVGLFGLLLPACGQEEVERATGEIEDAAGDAAARAIAEELRVALAAQELGQDENLRDVATIRDAVEDLPGDPQVVGLDDADGDGRDDDGKLEVRAGDQAACLVISGDGGSVDVEGGGCATAPPAT